MTAVRRPASTRVRPRRAAPAGSLVARRWLSNGCCSPSRGASAPASRWRSRRWRGWCGRSSRPCTATTRSSTTSSSSSASSARASCSSTTSPTCRRVARSCSRPTARRRRSSPPPAPRQLRRRLGVPARHQGPPRGAGARRQGLPHRLRRPRGPRGGGRHDGRRARRDHRVESVDEVERAARTSTSPVALLAQTTLSHRDWAGVAVAVARAVPRRVDARAQRPVLRHDEPPVGADGAGRRGATRSSSSARRTRRTPGALEKLAREAGCSVGRTASTTPTSSRPSSRRPIVGVTAGASAPNELVEAVIARLAPDDGVEVVRVTDEDEYFPPPRNLRELQAAIEVTATVDARRLADRSPCGRRPRHCRQRRARGAPRLTRPSANAGGDLRGIEERLQVLLQLSRHLRERVAARRDQPTTGGAGIGSPTSTWILYG